jgi:hypothetical protein
MFPDDKLNILVSFAYLSINKFDQLIEMKYQSKISSLILDCGAFSARNLKKVIHLDKYTEYLISRGEHFDYYYNLDLDFDNINYSSSNAYNLIMLQDAGLNPVPVMHSMNTIELSSYLNDGYPHLAIGSVQKKTNDKLEYVFSSLPKGNETKFHVFGVTDWRSLIRFPIYSCDSSSWAQSSRYRLCYWWNPKIRAPDRLYFGSDLLGNKARKFYQFSPYIQDFRKYLYDVFGFKVKDLLGKGGATNRQIVNIKYYVKLQDFITNEHVKRGFPTWGY